MEAVKMDAAMRYMIALETGEIVKVTDFRFESTGMFVIPLEERLPTLSWLTQCEPASVNT